MNIGKIISNASNLKGGKNPPFTVDDFREMYPQFFISNAETGDIEPVIPKIILNEYMNMADSSLNQSRYKSSWLICMGLFVAHFISLYLESMVEPGGDIAHSGKAKGLISSKTVDGVSVSYDYSQTTQDMIGYGDFKLTTYGQQLITIMKAYNKGGMYIY